MKYALKLHQQGSIRLINWNCVTHAFANNDGGTTLALDASREHYIEVDETLAQVEDAIFSSTIKERYSL